MKNSKTERVLMRISPCGCGCRGTDPWHAKSFDRVIRNERVLSLEESPFLPMVANDFEHRVAALAEIKAPSGVVKVERTELRRISTGRISPTGWARDDLASH